MASMDTSLRDTLAGANLALRLMAANRKIRAGQWLTIPLGPAPFSAQTSPSQPLARTTAIVDFDHTAFAGNGAQTFTATIPSDQMDIMGALTAVVNVPSIANQTASRVDKYGISGGISSLSATAPVPSGGVITGFSNWTAQSGVTASEGTGFTIGTTRAITFDNLGSAPENAVDTGSGFVGTLTRIASGNDQSDFTLTISDGGTLYTDGDFVTFTIAGYNINNFRVRVSLDATPSVTPYDGSAVSIAIGAPPAGGAQAVASGVRVPRDVMAAATGFDFDITNPGYGYTSAPTVTISGGGFSSDVSGTATLTSNATGENLRYIVPGAGSGRDAAALVATNSAIADADNNALLGTVFLVESDIVKSYGNVAKTIAGLAYPASATDSNYHNSIDGAGVQDIAAYYLPYAPALLFTEVQLQLSNKYLDGCVGEHILEDALVFTPQGFNANYLLNGQTNVRRCKQQSSRKNQTWHVEFPLFTRDPKSMFPTCAVEGQKLKLVVKTRPWTDIVCNGTGGAFASLANGASSITLSGTAATTVKLDTLASAASSFLPSTNVAATPAGAAVAAADFSMQLLVEGYIVSDEARSAMRGSQLIIPFVQNRIIDVPIDPITDANSKVTIDVAQSASLPLTSISVAGRLKTAELSHRWDDFAGAGDPLSCTTEFPMGRVRRPLFSSVQFLGNTRKLLSLDQPVGFNSALQMRDHGKRVPPNFHVWCQHFSNTTPLSIQHDSYIDPGQMDKLQIVLQPDPAVFADNSAALGNNGKKDNTPTVSGGQQIQPVVWGRGRNFLIVQHNTARVAFK